MGSGQMKLRAGEKMQDGYEAVLILLTIGVLIQLVVGAWVVVTINRLLRTQTLSLGVMQALAARSQFAAALDKVQAAMPTAKVRKDDVK